MPPEIANEAEAPQNEGNLTAQLNEAANQPDVEQVSQEASAPSSPAASAVSAPPVPQTPAWREVATELGFQIPVDADEKQLFKQVFQGYTNGQRAQQHLQQVLPHWSEFQNFLSERQQRQEQAAKPKEEDAGKPWWNKFFNPPEYDPSWRNLVTKDLDGNLIPAQGAPPDIVQKYLTAEQHRQKVADQLTSNPFEYLQDPVKHLAKEQAKEVFNEMMAKREEQELIQRTINAPEMAWLYAADDKGTPVLDIQGNKQLSEWGQVYKVEVDKAYQRGWSTADQIEFALAKTQAYFAMKQAGQPQAQQPQGQQTGTARERANEGFHKQHERSPNMAAILPGPAQSVAPPATHREPLDLRELMVQDLKDYTENDINEFVLRRKTG